MTGLVDEINQLDFPATKAELLDALHASYQLSCINLTEEERVLLRQDLDFFYHESGRWIVHNTFAGGIIFLREPETIIEIEMQFHSGQNKTKASVVYSSEKRNARNVKYKPNAGQVESETWNMLGVFPNFGTHQKYIKVVLMAIIGKIIKQVCECLRRESWFMQFEKPFDIKLFLDEEFVLKYSVEL